MGMPKNLVCIRHGESEGNRANALSRKGDDSMFTEEFLGRHSASWHLTEEAKRKAPMVRSWLDEHIVEDFDRFYASPHIRAMETAAYLDLPNARWKLAHYLRERDYGDLDVMTIEDRKKRFAENLRRREIDPLYWTPVGGESMAGLLFLRLEKMLDTLHRECDGKNVIIVSHGEVMWGLRYILERMTHREIMQYERSKNPHDRIHNFQIIHYTRIDPDSGEMTPYLNWVRSICPTDLTLSDNQWHKIIRRTFTNEELLQEVQLRSGKYE